MLYEFRHIFTTDQKKLKMVKVPPYEIKINENKPVNCKPYPLTITQREIARKLISDLETSGVISRSKSPWASPAFLKKKPNSTEGRLLVDYKKVNKLIQGDSNSTPRVATVLEAVGQGHIFSQIDLISSYFQFQIHKNS